MVTAIEPQARRRDRFNVFLDGRYAFALDGALAAGLRVGHVLSDDEVAAFQRRDAEQRAFDAALSLLGYRRRSERELRQRLARKGFAADLVEAALERLRRLGLVDDVAFARSWVEARLGGRPRGPAAVKSELRQKGVSREIVGEAIAPIEESEEELAFALARQRVPSLRGLDRTTFRRRLGSMLLRRGFGYGVAQRVVDALWQEREPSSESEHA
ncbi:MAG TPA: RecX family transcriptional regulator [Chloroflexota bacterium]